MRRRMPLPLAGLVALALSAGLAGCGTGPAPEPTPSSTSATETPSVAPTLDPGPEIDPTTVDALPGSAFLRVAVTAVSGGEETRLSLTFDRAASTTSRPADVETVQQACPNAVQGGLSQEPGSVVIGSMSSTLVVDGAWPEGLSVVIAPGGTAAAVGRGAHVLPPVDSTDGFGCSIVTVDGAGEASISSLLFGDPALTTRGALEEAISHALFGFEPGEDSTADVVWKDCIIQLSSAARRVVTERGWTETAEFTDGFCRIGDAGSV